MHEFSWLSVGRNAVAGKQMMGRNAAEGGWLILDHAGRLKFQSRLVVVTGAIVIGRDNGLSSTSRIATIQMRFLASWRTTTGRADGLGTCSTYPNGRVCGELVNDEYGEKMLPVVMGHRSLDLSSISCSLELFRVAHNYGECCVFVLTLYFCLNPVLLSMT